MQVVVAGALTAGRIASIGDDTDTVIGCAALRRVPPIAVALWFGALEPVRLSLLAAYFQARRTGLAVAAASATQLASFVRNPEIGSCSACGLHAGIDSPIIYPHPPNGFTNHDSLLLLETVEKKNFWRPALHNLDRCLLGRVQI
jgi:hypothetical protein